ncbi:MAG TPA: serine hydrolase domain-containing protein [Bryobacteraceae bacterium]|nr:serine hydrolase domain-containing protein [Bryobacteraceae bacterium]
MPELSRREFGGVLLALSAVPRHLLGASGIEPALRAALARRKIPCATAMVATAGNITYSGVFGTRDSTSGVKVNLNSIFAIASMTKAVTSAAAMQLVERGKLKLDEPAAKHLPELASLKVLAGFDASGKPILRPNPKPLTLRLLMTHTSGCVYDTWDADMLRYEKATNATPVLGSVAPLLPLAFTPGTRWQYGTGMDWTGRLVEAVSGLTLEQYFRRNILDPLGMADTTFILPADKFDRLVARYHRGPDGTLKEDPRTMPPAPKAYNGGGGLYSTAPDYVRFMQMILRKGRGPGKEQILQPKTVEMMSMDQTGGLSAGKLKTARPDISSDVDFHPGAKDGYTFGFLINTTAYEGGRSAGSLAWAGVYNTFYWIDPKRGICAALMMQFLPFADREAVAVLRDFEHAVYAA